MKLMLDSIIIFVKSTDTLKNFYINKLNLQLIEEIESKWVLLKAGGCSIGLHKTGKQYESRGVGVKVDTNTKIVFEVDGDIFKHRDKLFSENVIISEVKTFDNYDYWLCDGEDPEGNIFQFKQRK